jgi:hypothetical protein
MAWVWALAAFGVPFVKAMVLLVVLVVLVVLVGGVVWCWLVLCGVFWVQVSCSFSFVGAGGGVGWCCVVFVECRWHVASVVLVLRGVCWVQVSCSFIWWWCWLVLRCVR